jgi:hypothetical protein
MPMTEERIVKKILHAKIGENDQEEDHEHDEYIKFERI